MVQNVVVGVDGSPSSEEAVRSALEVLAGSGGTLHLVGAYRPHAERHDRLPSEFEYSLPTVGEMERLLDAVASHAAAPDVSVVTHPVTADPAEAMARVAEQEHADLIVLGHHRRRHWGHRSISRRLTRLAPCNVLIVSAH